MDSDDVEDYLVEEGIGFWDRSGNFTYEEPLEQIIDRIEAMESEGLAESEREVEEAYVVIEGEPFSPEELEQFAIEDSPFTPEEWQQFALEDSLLSPEELG